MPLGDGSSVVLLCGGVGGARLADGMADVVPPGRLTVVVNTGDDLVRYGLHVSPDVDTVVYALARRADPVRGWGLAGDTGTVMEAVAALGDEPWFFLGDRDLATHLLRTALLAKGRRLTEVTVDLGARLGARARVLPMSDDPVRTVVVTDEGERSMQEWFVRDRCLPPARGVRYAGASAASLSPEARGALDEADVVVVGPSNPYLSIGPFLALPGTRHLLARIEAPVVAVSPIVGGRALKGPAAEMLASMGGEASAAAVAEHYAGLLDGFVIDEADAGLADRIVATGAAVLVTDAVMRSPADRRRLAERTLSFASGLRPRA